MPTGYVEDCSDLAALFSKLSVHDRVVGTPIDKDDNMRSSGREAHYFSVGLDALRNVLIAIASAKIQKVGRILDYPSGFGRVTRYLRAAFPDVAIDVGDIWEKAVRQCAASYSAEIISNDWNASSDEKPAYDIIFCGSLVTHLPENKSVELLDFFSRRLTAGGVAIVSTCGRTNLGREQVSFNEKVFQTKEKLVALAQLYECGQYAFVDYPGQPGYGRSFIPVSWFQDYVRRNSNCSICGYFEAGWDSNQDVVVLKKIAR
jgi:SAM-dependent methyltransferase